MKKYIILIFVLLLLPAFIYAETIYLQDGTIIKGKIIKTDDSFLYVETLYGTNKIKRLFIKKVEYEKLTPVYDKEPDAITPPKPPKPRAKLPPKRSVTPIRSVKHNKKPILPPRSIVTPRYNRYNYNKYSRNPYVPPKSPNYFNLMFSVQVVGFKDESSEKDRSLALSGIAFKYFNWASCFGFGMNIAGHEEKSVKFYDDDGFYHDGQFKWITFGATMFIRFPRSHVSPYIGFGPSLHTMRYKENESDVLYPQYTGSTVYVDSEYESKFHESRVGGHFDIGIDFYLWKKIILDLGVRNYVIDKSDKILFNKFKTFSAFYFNVGLMF